MSQEDDRFISTQIQGRLEDYKHKVAISTDLSRFILAAPQSKTKTKTKTKAKPKQRNTNRKDRIRTISSHVRNRFKFNNDATQRRTLVEMLAKTEENEHKTRNVSKSQLHDSQTWSKRRVRLIPPAYQSTDTVVSFLDETDETHGMWAQSSGAPTDLGDTDIEALYDYAEHGPRSITLCDVDSGYNGYTQTLSQVLNEDYENDDNDDNESIHMTRYQLIENSSSEDEVLTCEIENSSGEEELLCM